MKRFGFALLTSALVWTLGCGGQEQKSDSGKTVITFRTMQLSPKFDDYFEKLIAEYEAAHPEVEIEWQDMPHQNYETKLMTSYMGDSAPDVINLPSESLLTYVDAGYLLPLDDWLSQETLNSFVPTILNDAAIFENQVYALPWYASSVVTFANKEILEEAGLPADEPPLYLDNLEEICRQVRDETGLFAAFPIYTESGTLKTHLLGAGVELIDEETGKAAFNTQRGVEVLEFWTDLYRENLVPSEALASTHRRPIEQYKAGRLAILNTGPQFLGQIREGAPNIYSNTIVGPEMQWKDYELHLVALHMIAVSQTSDHPDIAADFAAFVTNGPNQLAFCKLTTIIPSVTTALDDPYFSEADDSLEGKARMYSAEQVRNGIVLRPMPEQRKLNAIFEETIEKVALGEMEAATALAEAEEKWNEVIGQ